VSKANQQQETWLSDQAMWEMTLGQRDSALGGDVEEVIMQADEFDSGWDDVPSDDELARALKESYKQPSTQPTNYNRPAEFSAREPNPHVSTQDVTDVVARMRGWRILTGRTFKYMAVVVLLCLASIFGFFVSLDDWQKSKTLGALKNYLPAEAIQSTVALPMSGDKTAVAPTSGSVQAVVKIPNPAKAKHEPVLGIEERVEMRRQKQREAMVRMRRERDQAIVSSAKRNPADLIRNQWSQE